MGASQGPGQAPLRGLWTPILQVPRERLLRVTAQHLRRPLPTWAALGRLCPPMHSALCHWRPGVCVPALRGFHCRRQGSHPAHRSPKWRACHPCEQAPPGDSHVMLRALAPSWGHGFPLQRAAQLLLTPDLSRPEQLHGDFLPSVVLSPPGTEISLNIHGRKAPGDPSCANSRG